MCAKDFLYSDPYTPIVMLDKMDWSKLNQIGEPECTREYDFQICATCFKAMIVPFVRANHYDNYHGKNVVGEDLRNHKGTKCP